MCRDGRVQGAYDLAIFEREQDSDQVQADRKIGWALYYLIKGDADRKDYQSLNSHLDELNGLDNLSIPEDNMIFENVLFKVAMFIKNDVSPRNIDSPAKLSTLFSKLRGYTFEPSRGYSFLLSSIIRCEAWHEMADFLDWWNLENLRDEDYMPFQLDNGMTIMSVAERAFIAKSKALLRLNDPGRIEEFLPQMDTLMNNHPEMTYPGFFYGKLLLSLGSNPEEALRVLVPFARRKVNEFWIWQLLGEVFVNEPDKQLACLLRAVHCRTNEDFLGKVRIKLANIYIQRNMFDYAKYQIDRVVNCYLKHGWHFSNELDVLVHQPWIDTVTSNDGDIIDYQSITDDILCEGSEEAIAVVTFVNQNTHRAYMVYGYQKRMSQRLRFRVGPGTVLKINYVVDGDDRPRVLSAGRAQFPTDLTYARVVDGRITKRNNHPFAFIQYNNNETAFIAPDTVTKYNVSDGEEVRALIVYDYNRRQESWDWTCVSINRHAN